MQFKNLGLFLITILLAPDLGANNNIYNRTIIEKSLQGTVLQRAVQNDDSDIIFYDSFESASNWVLNDFTRSRTVGSSDGRYCIFSKSSSSSARDSWAFSPIISLTGGVKYKISMKVKAPGINSIADEFRVLIGFDSNKESQQSIIADYSEEFATIFEDWSLIEMSFTPDISETYSLSINHCTSEIGLNSVYFDEVSVCVDSEQVTEPDPEPDPTPDPEPLPDNIIKELPYETSFENEGKFPEGWVSVDPEDLVSVSKFSNSQIYPLTGEYHLVSHYDSKNSRDAWVYSPSFEFVKGREYTLSFYLCSPGYGSSLEEFKVTIGSQRSPEYQTRVLLDYTGDNSVSLPEWTKVVCKFEVQEDGYYNIALVHCTKKKYVNILAIDDFSITNKPYSEPPVASIFTKGGIWSMYNDRVNISSEEKVEFVSVVENVQEVEWSFQSAFISHSSDFIVSNFYTGDCVEEINFEARNTIIDEKVGCALSFNVFNPAEVRDTVYNLKPTDERIVALKEYDHSYVVGLNDSYDAFAEKFRIKDGKRGYLYGINLFVYEALIASENANEELTVLVQEPSVDGLPGDVIGEYKISLVQMLGGLSISKGVTECSIRFVDPIRTNGSFFVTIEWPAVLADNSNYLGVLTSDYRAEDDCTLYLRNGSWSTAASFIEGFNSSAYMSFDFDYTEEIITGLDSNKVVDIKVVGGVVSGVESGDVLEIYDLSGRLVKSLVAGDVNVEIKDLPKGYYILNVNNNIILKFHI